MPNAYIKKLAAEGKGDVAELESKWKTAKERAEAEGKTDNFAYITSIFQRSLGIKSSALRIKAAQRLTATHT